MIWLNVGIVLLLILVEGFFVASEMALVSLREGQVRQLADRGRRGRRVQRLVANPNRFLSAVQIGVTTTALLSSAFGAVTLSESTSRGLQDAGLGKAWAGAIGFLGVTLLIAYVTLVVGELVPKRLALQRAERIAPAIAPAIDRTAALARPFIWLLSRSTDALVRLLGYDPDIGREAISEEELRDLVTAHESLGRDERRFIEEVFASGERQLREVMVPRTEVTFLDASLTVTKAAKLAADSPYSRFPVVRGSHDDVAGFVHVRDLFAPSAGPRRGMRVADLVREVTLLPDTKKVLVSLSEMRRSGQHIAVVVDEYGGTAGIVTLEDLIEELVGEIRDEYDVRGGEARRLRDGDVEVDGLLNLTDFEEETGVALPDGPYETAAGFVMAMLGHLPRVGEAVEVAGTRLKIIELDGRRVSRLRVTPLDLGDDSAGAPAGSTDSSRAAG